jgi:predicted secreted protein
MITIYYVQAQINVNGINGIIMLVTRKDNGKTIELFLRDLLEVRLPESQVSGYMWELNEDKKSCIMLIDSDYAERGPARFNGLGERSWFFEPVSSGMCTLKFSLIRPWSKPSPEFMINVIVK